MNMIAFRALMYIRIICLDREGVVKIPDTSIPAEQVAHLLNEWYLTIQKFSIAKSKKLQKKAQNMLEKMSPNQDILLYYSLLDFRCQLNYEKPQQLKKVHRKIEKLVDDHEHLNALLTYYYDFFNGLYEFKQRNLIRSLHFYRKAVEEVNHLDDEIERGQCYYRLSQVYFKLSYSVISILYANMAIKIFDRHKDYYILSIYCRVIVANNLIHDHCFTHALSIFTDANQLAFEKQNNQLIAITSFNIGIAQIHLKAYEEAEQNFYRAMICFHKFKDYYEPRAICSYYESLLMQKKYKQAAVIYEKGIESAKSWHDNEYQAKINLLKAIYQDEFDQERIDASISKLMVMDLYEYVLSLTISVAERCRERRMDKQAIKYYELSNEIRNHITEGAGINEKIFNGNGFGVINSYVSAVGG